MEFSNRDWKLFREKLPGWQEAYIDRSNQEYIGILTGNGNPSDKFWELQKRIHRDKQGRGVILQLSKNNMVFDIAAMINDGVITFSEVEEFSDELKETVHYLCNK